MPATSITDQSIIAIAERYSIPPAVLEGLVRAQGSSPTFNLPMATLGAYNISAADVASDPLLALEVAARQLTQAFQQYGGWEQALSYTLAGDPQAFTSPTSALGGLVYSILGAAASDPTFGLSGYQPADPRVFQRTSQGFGQHLSSLATTGGVVTRQSAAAFQQQAATVAYQSDPNLQQMASDVLSRMSQISGQKYAATPANLALIVTMARGEGMPAGDYNWLATTQGQGVGTVPGTPGVQVFGDYQSGVDATARTFLNGNYDSILNGMRSGLDLQTMARDPGVQANLEKWQGGSTEDVTNLQRLANQPGTSGGSFGGTTITDSLQAAAQNNGQSYSAGQCTWYAARAAGYIPANLGDAQNWAANASAMGMTVDHQPAPGTVVVYGAGGSYSSGGHVAVVQSVNPDGSFTVSEMNVDGQYVADQRTSSMDGVIGFIHPPQGTDMTQAVPWLHQQTTQQAQQQKQQQPGAQQASATASTGAVSSTLQRAQARDVSPGDVAEFAAQLQSAGIDPQTFASLFPQFAAQARMLSATPVVQVDEFIQAAQALQQQGQPVTAANLIAWQRAQPHPVHSNLTQGQVHDAKQMALLAAVPTGRVPTTAEAARMASSQMAWKDAVNYYQQSPAYQQAQQSGIGQGASALAGAGGETAGPPPQGDTSNTAEGGSHVGW